jgi:hypothetical protein
MVVRDIRNAGHMIRKDELDHLREQAARCRRLAADFADLQTVQALTQLAAEYERRARELEERRSAGDADVPVS